MSFISLYKGVNYDVKKGKWCSRVSLNGKRIYLGCFNSESDAVIKLNSYKESNNIKIQDLNFDLNLENEVFIILNKYPSYEVSNMGRVRSLFNGCKRVICYSLNRQGYRMVKLQKTDKSTISRSVHTLVAEAFLNHIPNGKQDVVVDHIDDDKLNNKLSNLQLVSQRFNVNKNNKNPFIGAKFNKKKNRYSASICIEGKSKYLGSFKSKEEASKEYYKALEKITDK